MKSRLPGVTVETDMRNTGLLNAGMMPTLTGTGTCTRMMVADVLEQTDLLVNLAPHETDSIMHLTCLPGQQSSMRIDPPKGTPVSVLVPSLMYLRPM